MATKANKPAAQGPVIPQEYRAIARAVSDIIAGRANATEAGGTLWAWMKETALAFPDATIKAKGKKGFYIEGVDAQFDAAESAIEKATGAKLPGTWKALKSVARKGYVEGVLSPESTVKEVRDALSGDDDDADDTFARLRECIGYAKRGDYSKAPEVAAAWQHLLPHAVTFCDAVEAFVNAADAAERARIAERERVLNSKRNPRYGNDPILPAAPDSEAGRAAGERAPVPDNIAEERAQRREEDRDAGTMVAAAG